MELGIDLIGAAKAAAGAFLPAVLGPAAGGAPGRAPAEPGGFLPTEPSGGTYVSPTIQTAVSPQISPTMVQQQASPGAAVQAAPSMYPAAQSAIPSIPIPGIPAPTPQYGYGAQPAYGAAPATGADLPWGIPSAMQTGEQRINWTLIAIAGAAAIASIAIFTKRGKGKRTS